MKKIAWISYGVLIIALTLLGLGMAISTGNMLIIISISSIFTVLYLSGLYGYVFNKAIWKPSGWRTIFWINIASIVLRSLPLFSSPTPEAIIDTVVSIIFSLPLLYALYKYSSPSCKIWNETHYGKQKILLSNLFENTNELSATVTTETASGNNKTSVVLKIEEDEFIVKIQKNIDEKIESFSNNFSELEDVAKFIENNTSVRVSDFS